MPNNQRNIATCIILSFVTCGIYGIYWYYCSAQDMNYYSNGRTATGGSLILLSIITCGIYMLYWFYIVGCEIDDIKRNAGMYGSNNTGIVYLLLSIFGLSIVSMALMQTELNNFASPNNGRPMY